MNIRIDIIIPSSTDFATLSRATRFVDEFTSELREFAAVAVGWGNGAQPQPAPNGHPPAPQPEPQPAPAAQHRPARADIAAFPKSAKARRYGLAEDELRGRVLAELVSLADDGVAPSQARWDEQRDPRLPGAAGVTHRLKMKWGEICALAGLETKDAAYRRSVRKVGVRAAAQTAAPADEQEDAGGEDAGF